jgi:hypothetical protein
MKGVFITREALCHYSNGRTFDSLTSAYVRRFENHASCAGYPDDQVICSTFQKKVHRRRDGRAAVDICWRLITVYQTHHQPSVASQSHKPNTKIKLCTQGFFFICSFKYNWTTWHSWKHKNETLHWDLFATWSCVHAYSRCQS